MKKTKKIVSLLLCLTISSATLTSCGHKDEKPTNVEENNIFKTMSEIQDIKSGTSSTEIIVDFPDEEGNIKSQIGFDFASPIIQKLLVNDSTLQISSDNISTMLFEKIGAEYISITADDLSKIAQSQLNGMQSNIITEQLNNPSDYVKYINIGLKVLEPKFINIIKSIEPNILKVENEKACFVLNSENIQPFIIKLSEFIKNDGSSILTEIANNIKNEMGENDAVYKLIIDNISEYENKLNDFSSKLDSFNYDNLKKSQPVLSIQSFNSGEKGKRTAEFNVLLSLLMPITEEKDIMNFKLSCNTVINEKECESVSIPEDIKSICEIK